MRSLAHWADKRVESMYDKTLLAAEIAAIKKYIKDGARVCDAGCGEGEGTLEYASIHGAHVDAFDLYPERLEMASGRLTAKNVRLREHNILQPLAVEYDVVVSQRLLINLGSQDEQKLGLKHLAQATTDKLILSEGSVNGATELNKLRALLSLPPIPTPAHNLFIKDEAILEWTNNLGLRLLKQEGFGAYYFLTRGVQPALRNDFHWFSNFNRSAVTPKMAALLPDADRFSRVKVWAFEKRV